MRIANLMLGLVFASSSAWAQEAVVPNTKTTQSVRLHIPTGQVTAAERSKMLDSCVSILDQRVKTAGMKDVTVSRDRDEIVVETEATRMAELEAALPSLIRRARLEFCLIADANRDPFDLAKETARIEEALATVDGKAEKLSVRDFDRELPNGLILRWVGVAPELESQFPSKPPFQLVVRDPNHIFANSCIESFYLDTDAANRPAIGFEIRRTHQEMFGEFTEKSIGRRVAILLDDELVSAPTLSGRIEKNGIIEGGVRGFSEQEIRLLTAALKAGSLPVPLERVPDGTKR